MGVERSIRSALKRIARFTQKKFPEIFRCSFCESILLEYKIDIFVVKDKISLTRFSCSAVKVLNGDSFSVALLIIVFCISNFPNIS